MIRRVVVPTCVGVWHSYDAYRISQTSVQKNNFFFYSDTPWNGVRPTPVRHSYNTSQTSVPKEVFFLCFTLLRHISDIYERVKDVLKNNDGNEGLKTLHFDYNIFFYSRWINKDQILSYLVLKLFLINNLLNFDAHVYILIFNLDLL
jgi:hypothetical protein